jgi:thiol-disulfide isomerase/thioredoxin
MKSILQEELERLKPTALGSIAPEITLPDQAMQYCSLTDHEANATIILFWNYSCTTCRRILDDFRKVTAEYDYKNIKVYTVFTGDDKEVWDAWVVRRLNSDWTNTWLSGHDEVLKTYRIERIPTLFLLNAQFEIVDKGMTVGELDKYLLDMPYTSPD